MQYHYFVEYGAWPFYLDSSPSNYKQVEIKVFMIVGAKTYGYKQEFEKIFNSYSDKKNQIHN